MIPSACLNPSSLMSCYLYFPSPPLASPLTQTPPVQPCSKSPYSLKTLSTKSPFSQCSFSPPPNCKWSKKPQPFLTYLNVMIALVQKNTIHTFFIWFQLVINRIRCVVVRVKCCLFIYHWDWLHACVSKCFNVCVCVCEFWFSNNMVYPVYQCVNPSAKPWLCRGSLLI